MAMSNGCVMNEGSLLALSTNGAAGYDKSRAQLCSYSDAKKMPKPVIPGLGIFLKILVYDFNYQFTTLIEENIYSGRCSR